MPVSYTSTHTGPQIDRVIKNLCDPDEKIVSADYNVTSSNDILWVKTSSGPITLNIMNNFIQATCKVPVTIIDVDKMAYTNNITLLPESGLIMSSSYAVMNGDGDTVTLVSDGTDVYFKG